MCKRELDNIMSYVSDDYLVDCDASRGKMSARGAQINNYVIKYVLTWSRCFYFKVAATAVA